MANILSMAKQEQIRALAAAGWSRRKIAKHLKINRRTVSSYLNDHSDGEISENPNCTISTAGSGTQNDEEPSQRSPQKSKQGRQSECEPFRNVITAGIEKGQSADLIWRDLKTDHDFKHSYESVKRFVRKLREGTAIIEPVQRLECLPGEEAQVDFGFTRTIRNAKGNLTQSNVLRVTLSFSRKGYTETLPSQSTECLIRALENAFRHFGGVPATLVIDNLKAAVKKADWFDPEINPKFASFARHYDTVVLPTKPYTPQHKGKVERDVQYVKRSALKGKEFGSINEQNNHLTVWEKTVADTRIHGTTRKQVNTLFEEHEKAALKPLPIDLFPCFQEGRRKVHRDAYVEVQRSYYAVPPEYIGRQLWVRWTTKTVRILDDKMESVASHVRLEKGQFSACKGARGKTYGEKDGATGLSFSRSSKYWIDECATRIGILASKWAAKIAVNRPETGIRVIQGLLQIGVNGKHLSAEIEQACVSALDAGDYTLSYIKNWLKASAEGNTVYRQEQLNLLDEHEVIRSMSVYQNFLEEQQEDTSTQ